MTTETIEYQAKVYIYDLNNCARENGFKPEENWQLSLATSQEKKDIEKKYHPTVSTKVLPETLGELFGQVNEKLIQAKPEIAKKFDGDTLYNKTNEHQYLVAFNPKRERRH
ncbi:hypothetical protein KXQ82_06980 [Mucilaginibacter sp. HMF5004]|uniref:hypothetical protein n=1 Tax=Mucilaginibacter rivuli TaxID=2857527 RepID=UPI001C5FBEDB|nr:hypothetical protein [Mucilaginibacter rivuli]MBW4889450.1 hypothetical protein [Mucilaginibacter rivuli]